MNQSPNMGSEALVRQMLGLGTNNPEDADKKLKESLKTQLVQNFVNITAIGLFINMVAKEKNPWKEFEGVLKQWKETMLEKMESELKESEQNPFMALMGESVTNSTRTAYMKAMEEVEMALMESAEQVLPKSKEEEAGRYAIALKKKDGE